MNLDLFDILKIASIGGALFCAGAYVYGFILNSKGNRRMHTASLLCSGVALANLPVLLSVDIAGVSVVATTNVVIFILLSTMFQSFSAFRGRKGDRRASDRRADDRRAEDRRAPAEAEPAIRRAA